MPVNIRSEDVNRLAEKLAARKQVKKTEAVRSALENELRRLNMGDCFAYALAKTHRTSLLFEGEDFAKTDIGRA